ncbi:FAD-binding protein [Breznakiella homolactica]|uniref:FAD-binding protein n=1 Tax=Breznakiella homolactica TaxID=2798577 RepID=A0A7T7XNC1_9SPIR|nr:FAD-binding protein [Breznakiella homolactica]QQO09519.1 FAD-binding protein [Breznakiella homolactica]
MKKRAILSFLAVLAACAVIFGCVSTKPNPGTYSAAEKGYISDVTVTVTVDEQGKITGLEAAAEGETPKIGGEAAPKMAARIIESQRLDCDVISGATLTSKAILSAAEKALKQAGVNTAAMKAQAAGTGKDELVIVDVAVVGAGASGTAAAAAAIDGGASVLMVEKTNNIGGISKFFAGGPFAVESHLQKEAGPKYSGITKNDVLQTLNDYSHYINYAPLTKAVVFKSGDTISWLEKWGITFHVNPETPQVAHRDDDMKWTMYHWYDLFSYEPTEKAAIDVVHENLAKAGLDLRFNTTATKLLTDGSGRVTGFTAVKEDGKTLTVHAKAVVLGTGGFAGNPEMMQEYFNTPYLGLWGENGSGVKMAWEAGAAKWDTASSLLHGNGPVPPVNPTKLNLNASPFNQILRSPVMWIDQSGNRYCNEEAVWDTAYASNTGYSVGGIYYVLVDTATLEGYTAGRTLVMDTAVGGPNMAKADFIELAEEGVYQGIITKGATIAELAEKLGMEPERLTLNVNEYNTAVRTKNDPYGKSAASLVYGVERGPFYAVKMQISNLGTLGGVRVNEKLQATDTNLKPIPGLYVVGNDAAGFYGNITSYPPYEGLATGFAWNSGRIAGENAALDAKK